MHARILCDCKMIIPYFIYDATSKVLTECDALSNYEIIWVETYESTK